MDSIWHRTTDQGLKTRERLLQTLSQTDGLTRNEIALASGLTYEQVRRQTQNLVFEGKIIPRIDERRHKRYFIKSLYPTSVPSSLSEH
jgi:predicted ArsR family transcriptional regulator